MGALLDKPITEKTTESGNLGDIRFAVSEMQGWRPEHEDTHLATVFDELANFYVFAVFDGHGGRWTADYAKENIMKVIRRQEHFKFYASLPAQSLRDHPIGLELLKSSLSTAFLDLDEEMLKSMDRIKPPEVEGGPMNVDKSGSTAVLVIVTNRHIICCNCGDSRSVYRTRKEAVQLSFDHKPNHDEEQTRIENAGGYVSMKRVDGDLAVSRSLGDFQFKGAAELPPDLQKVTCIPDFTVVDRNRRHDEFILIACDGIWDVLTSADACALVQDILNEGERDLGLVCEEVLDVCLEQQSKDNMTIIVAAFPGMNQDGSGGGVAARRALREVRMEEEERKKREREFAKEKLQKEAQEVRKRLARRFEIEASDSD